MKKAISLLLALVLCLSLCACGEDENITAANIHPDYVGEWKANVKVSSENEYEVYVITLNADGTGSYRDRSGTWEYSEAGNMIVLTVPGGTAALEIVDENGKTALKFYQDIYYRASEFEE